MTDDIERRLRAADPLPPADADRPAGPSLRALVEATMDHEDDQPLQRRPRWLPAVAAAAAITVLGLGGYALTRGDPPAPAAQPAPSTTTLAVPRSDVMASCLQYSVDALAEMPIAFSGEVVAVRDGSVVLDVERWYRGGDADQVELASTDGPQVLLEGAVAFEQGGRYLVTASQGTVSSCGFSAEWSPARADDFEQAFTG